MNLVKNEITIPVGDATIYGDLSWAKQSRGIVILAYGNGSSRFNSRSQYVARQLNAAHFSTFLFDLLTAEEDRIDIETREFRFNIPLLAKRLVLVTNWIQSDERTHYMPIGYFGASTGAAAALMAAAQLPDKISAVVSQGGRPDLAEEYLSQVKVPTLLIVGEKDSEVIKLNKIAYEQLTCEKKVESIPKATHLFEEKGALFAVAQKAIKWFETYL